MLSNELLGAYLNDHLAGSTAGRDLAKKLVENNLGTELASFMKELLAEIEADRKTLEDLMDRLGVERSTLKQAGGWMAEKLSRLRFSRAVTKSAALSQLMEMEMLSMGIHGKLALWLTLRQISSLDSRLSGFDADSLIKRTQDQLDRLESHRQAAAAEACTG